MLSKNEESIKLYEGIIEDTKEDMKEWEEANKKWKESFIQAQQGFEGDGITITGSIKNSIVGGTLSNVTIDGNRMDQPPYPPEKFEQAKRLIETMEQKIKDLKSK